METGTETIQSLCLSTLPSSASFFFFLYSLHSLISERTAICSSSDRSSHMPFCVKVLPGIQHPLRCNIPLLLFGDLEVEELGVFALPLQCITLLPTSEILCLIILSLHFSLSLYACLSVSLFLFCILVAENKQESPS